VQSAAEQMYCRGFRGLHGLYSKGFKIENLLLRSKKMKMKKQDYSTSIAVDTTAETAFNCINAVSKWWTEDMEGSTQKLNDIFTVRFGETFITLKITASVPGKKIVWLVTDCNKHWLKNKKEWNGTQLIWEIAAKNKTTRIDFTHVGLTEGLECYDACENAWTDYLHKSLTKLLNS
jgi:hypothetical protein